jgi:hypothetical protein
VADTRWNGRAARATFERPPALAADRTTLLATLAERGLALRDPPFASFAGGVAFLPPREPDDFVEFG